MKRYPIICLLFIIFSLGLRAQIIVSPNSSLTIASGTTITCKSFTDSIHIQTGGIIVNNGILRMEQNSRIIEPLNNPITGTGFELSVHISNGSGIQHPGNLGLQIEDQNPGDTLTVFRFHFDTLAAMNLTSGVQRFFGFGSTDSSIQQREFRFFFDPSEYAGTADSLLAPYFIKGNSISLIDSAAFSGTTTLNFDWDTLGIIALGESYLKMDSLSPSQVCAGATVTLHYQTIGLNSTGNAFNAGLISGNDTLVLPLVNGNQILLPDTLIQGNYQFAIMGSNPQRWTINSLPLFVHPLPVLDLSTLPNLVCQNIDSVELIATPQGGVFAGSGVVSDFFYPGITGTGTFPIDYSYTDGFGCSTAAQQIIEVIQAPIVTLSPLQGICNNQPAFSPITGLPAGGIYSGIGISSNTINPILFSPGTYSYQYLFTDANGCTNSATSSIEIIDIPTVNIGTIAPFCSNDPLFPLTTGTPGPGIYSGPGVLSNTFYPSVAGSGNHQVIYSYSDANNCTNSDTTTVVVFEAPAVPIITENFQTLASTSGTSYQWYLNGNLLMGENSQFLTVTQNGFFQVEITDANGCSEISEPYNYQSVGIDELIYYCKAFPNPAMDIVTIETNFPFEEVQLYSTEGKLVHTTNQTGSALSISVNISTLKPGIYYLKFTGTTNSTPGISILKME